MLSGCKSEYISSLKKIDTMLIGLYFKGIKCCLSKVSVRKSFSNNLFEYCQLLLEKINMRT